jgi:hypothetical protein
MTLRIGGVTIELFNFAFSGVNLIPTILLALCLVYWLLTIIGLFDLDFLDLDVDVDVDAEVDLDVEVDMDLEVDGGGGSGPLHAIASFLNVGQVPFLLVLSLMILNFWILAMLIYFIPVKVGGLLNGLLLIPAFLISVFISKAEVYPLKGMFKRSKRDNTIENKVLDKRCVMLCDTAFGRLGQAKIIQEGAALVLNVTPEFKTESFNKGEEAFVFRKDPVKDLYYITKPLLKENYFSNGGY